mgnify:CR=1 FL=1
MNLEYLRHGKSLCGKVFRRFVETFNFHNDFILNLKGDADLPVVGGKVHIDRTDERPPVIRCQGCGNGGGGGGEIPQTAPGRFEISVSEDEESGEIAATFVNPYYDVGGKTYEASSVSSVTITGACILALKVTATGSEPSAEVVAYADLGALQSAQAGLDYYISPLYELDADGKVVCDFRTGPVIAMGEF